MSYLPAPLRRLSVALGLAASVALPAHAQSAFPTEPIAVQEADPALRALLPASVRDSGTLKMATDANYPPCQWYAPDGKMVGFEVDIWDALAQKLGVKLDVQSIDFAGLIPGVQGGRYDAAMECITDRVEREAVVDFVNHTLSYGNAAYYLAANSKVTPGDAKSLCGTTAAGQTGTDFLSRLSTFSDWCTAQGLSGIEISEFPQQSAVLLALFSGRIDFALSDSSAIEEIRANNPVEVGTIVDPTEKQNYLGIVVAKENKDLQTVLLEGLRAIKASGAYDAIYKKWNLEHAALDEFGINMTTTNPLK